VVLRFRTEMGQLFRAYPVLQVLSEWADEGFDAELVLRARGSKPLDENWYDTAVVMSLEEVDIKVEQ
jgi:hypothetical protein